MWSCRIRCCLDLRQFKGSDSKGRTIASRFTSRVSSGGPSGQFCPDRPRDSSPRRRRPSPPRRFSPQRDTPRPGTHRAACRGAELQTRAPPRPGEHGSVSRGCACRRRDEVSVGRNRPNRASDGVGDQRGGDTASATSGRGCRSRLGGATAVLPRLWRGGPAQKGSGGRPWPSYSTAADLAAGEQSGPEGAGGTGDSSGRVF